MIMLNRKYLYANKPETIQHLDTNIRATIAAIPAEMLCRVIENSTDLIHQVKQGRGGHLNDRLFKR